MHSRLIHSLAGYKHCSRCLLVIPTVWQPQFPTRRVRAQPRGAGSAVRNRTSRNAQLDLTRRDGPGRATSTRPMRRCPWRLGYGSAPPLQGASRGRESLREFGTRRRHGPRCDQAVAKLPEGRLDRSQDASSCLLRTFSGVFVVHTFDHCQHSQQNRARRLRRCRFTLT